MKKTKVFVILACMTCIFYTSCEKTGYHVDTNEISDDTRISFRGINETLDCEECPVGYCCCGIELAGTSGSAQLKFCGAFSPDTPTTPCGTASPPSPCSAISGSLKSINLNSSSHGRELFCVPSGGSFSIYNDDDEAVTIRFTCQAGETEADFEEITIDEYETVFFYSNGGCYLGECQ